MKIPTKALIAIAALALSQLMCSTAKHGTHTMIAYEDLNQNGWLDSNEPFIPGVSVTYDKLGTQVTGANGMTTFNVTLGNDTACIEDNKHNNITIAPPPGYETGKTNFFNWDCHIYMSFFFTVEEENLVSYLGMNRVEGQQAPAAVVEEATPTPTPTITLTPTITSTPRPQPMPALSMTANAIPSEFSRHGTLIKFTYRITNTGNVPIQGPIVLKDLYSDPSSIFCTEYLDTVVLQPGEFVDCASSREAKDADISAGIMADVMSVTATYTDPLTNNIIQISAQTQASSVYVKKDARPTKTPVPDS